MLLPAIQRRPRFFMGSDVQVVPVECVFAVFEVKAYLNKGEIESAFENMRAAKSLQKAAYFPGPVTTTKHVYGQPTDRWPMNFFLFASESDGLDTVFEHIQRLNRASPIDRRIDSVCILDKGLVVNAGPEGIQPVPRPETTPIAKPSAKALFTFYAIISNLLSQAVSEPVCINPYISHISHSRHEKAPPDDPVGALCV